MKTGADDDMVTNVLFLLLFYDILFLTLMSVLVPISVVLKCIERLKKME